MTAHSVRSWPDRTAQYQFRGNAPGRQPGDVGQLHVHDVDGTAPTVADRAGGRRDGVGTVTVAASASDNAASLCTKLTAPPGAEDTASPYSTPWNTTAVANGSHTR